MEYAKLESCALDGRLGTPVIGFNKRTGARMAFADLSAAARRMGKKGDAEIRYYEAEIDKACVLGTVLDGVLWSYGKLIVVPDEEMPEARIARLVGATINGYEVLNDTKYALENGDHLFGCKCAMCGSLRLFTDTDLLSGAPSACGCVASLALLERATPVEGARPKEEVVKEVQDGHSHELVAKLMGMLESADAGEPETAAPAAVDRAVSAKPKKPNAGRPGKRIYKYTLDWNFIGEYPSAAAGYLSVHPGAVSLSAAEMHGRSCGIYNCCRGAQQVAYGHRWRYGDEVDAEREAAKKAEEARLAEEAKLAEEARLEELTRPDAPSKILMLTVEDLSTGVVDSFRAIEDACKALSKRCGKTMDPNVVAEVLRHGPGECYNKYWEWEEVFSNARQAV